MDNKYILSIIVPSFNTSKYVDECLPSFVDDRLIEKIKDYRRWLDYCALDDAVAELADGIYVIPSDGKGVNFNLKEVMKKREELGRPLTDEEFEEFIIHDGEN